MPTSFQSVYGLPKGCIGTDLDAAASNVLAVPSNLIGGQYHASAALLWTNSVLQNCTGFNIFGLTVGATTTAARTLSFFASKTDKTTYDVAIGNILTVKSGASAGDYYPIGGPRGRYWGTDISATINLGGFAFITSTAELVGTLWWEPVGSY